MAWPQFYAAPTPNRFKPAGSMNGVTALQRWATAGQANQS